MAKHTYEPPPSAPGETRSYLGGATEEAIQVERREPGLLHIRVSSDPDYVGTLLDHGDGLYTLPRTPEKERVDNSSWDEILDRL